MDTEVSEMHDAWYRLRLCTTCPQAERPFSSSPPTPTAFSSSGVVIAGEAGNASPNSLGLTGETIGLVMTGDLAVADFVGPAERVCSRPDSVARVREADERRKPGIHRGGRGVNGPDARVSTV